MKNAREAKEFLVSQIVQEAQRQGGALSETERKMLYFSESGWTLPDMAAVSDKFDSEYDQNKYEKKIARLIREAYRHACKDAGETYGKWWASIHVLNPEDHYILVMIRVAGLRPRHDQVKLFASALGVVTILLLAILFSIRYSIHLPSPQRRVPSHASLREYIWVGVVCVFVVYQFLRFVIGAKKTDEITSKALRAFARVTNRVR